MEKIGRIPPLGWPTMNARGGGLLCPAAAARAVGRGVTLAGADWAEAVDVPASIVLAAHFTRLDLVCLP